MAIILHTPSAERRAEFLAAVKRSRSLHSPWVSPPGTTKAFGEYLDRLKSPARIGYWVQTEAGDLAGVFNISEIVRGVFLSAYLGFYAFVPHNGHGYMTLGLEAVLREAF